MPQVDYIAYTSATGDGITTGKFKDFLRNWGGNLRAFATQLQTDHNALDTKVDTKIGTTWTANVNTGGNWLQGLPTGTPPTPDSAASNQYVIDSVAAGPNPGSAQVATFKHFKLKSFFYGSL